MLDTSTSWYGSCLHVRLQQRYALFGSKCRPYTTYAYPMTAISARLSWLLLSASQTVQCTIMVPLPAVWMVTCDMAEWPSLNETAWTSLSLIQHTLKHHDRNQWMYMYAVLPSNRDYLATIHFRNVHSHGNAPNIRGLLYLGCMYTFYWENAYKW